MTTYLPPAGFHKHWPSSTCCVNRNDMITGEKLGFLAKSIPAWDLGPSVSTLDLGMNNPVRNSQPEWGLSPRALHTWRGWHGGVGWLWGVRFYAAAAAAAKSLQSCQTLCDSTDSSPPGSPVPGILQARTLEWVARSYVCSKMKDKNNGIV